MFRHNTSWFVLTNDFWQKKSYSQAPFGRFLVVCKRRKATRRHIQLKKITSHHLPQLQVALNFWESRGRFLVLVQRACWVPETCWGGPSISPSGRQWSPAEGPEPSSSFPPVWTAACTAPPSMRKEKDTRILLAWSLPVCPQTASLKAASRTRGK